MSTYELLGLAANALGRVVDRDRGRGQAYDLWLSLAEMMNSLEDEEDGKDEDQG
jgi:hypothetical protein